MMLFMSFWSTLTGGEQHAAAIVTFKAVKIRTLTPNIKFEPKATKTCYVRIWLNL